METEISSITNQLDKLRHHTESGTEYWKGRDIQPLLGYVTWKKFMPVLERAKRACESVELNPENHFVHVEQMVSIGSGAQRKQSDYVLSRYACYLIAMNDDTSKPEVGAAQTYFATQTRRMEMQDRLIEDERRLQLRDRVRTANKALGDAAKNAGVNKYGAFHDAGYIGLYGIRQAEIKKLKGIPKKDDLLNRVGREELAANEFRITQTKAKLVRDNVNGEAAAIGIHKQVGQDVRDTIKKIGGTMPEDLPPECPIKQLEQESKKRKRLQKKETKQLK